MIKYVLIDTRYKAYGSNNSFRYQLPYDIIIKSYIKINYLYLPRLNYLINSSNNSFALTFINDAGVSTYNIIISEGNYTPLELVGVINTIMGKTNSFNVGYNTNTYKFVFSANTDF